MRDRHVNRQLAMVGPFFGPSSTGSHHHATPEHPRWRWLVQQSRSRRGSHKDGLRQLGMDASLTVDNLRDAQVNGHRAQAVGLVCI